MRIEFAPPIPEAATILLAAIGAALACAMDARRPVRAALRILALLAVALLLLGPVSREWPERPPRPATVAILLDVSRSMATRDADGLARIDAARRALLDADPERILAPARVAWFAFARDARAIDRAEVARIPADGPATAIGPSLAGAFASTLDLAAAIVLSDGRDTSGASIEEVAARARARRVPIWTVPFGGADPGPDLAIAARPASPYAIAGGAARIDGIVYGTGLGERTVEIALLRRGETLSIRRATLGRGPATLSFPVVLQRPGSEIFLLRAAPIPGERNLANNEAHAVIRASDRRIRALFLEGSAARTTWDATFILRALRRDARLAVDAIRLGGDPRARQGAEGEPPAPPLDARALAAYDAVILAEGGEALLADAGALDAYVDAGGTALRILPADGDPIPVGRIEASGLHPAIEPLLAFASAASAAGTPILAVPRAAPMDARILARAARAPAVWFRAAGRGTEASVPLRELWRGAIAADADAFAAFWARLVVWLSRRSRPPIDLPEPFWEVGREGTIVVCANEGILEIVSPGGTRSRPGLSPVEGEDGVLQARFAPSEPGLHRAELVDGTGATLVSEPFAVAGPPGEETIVAADRAALERLSAASGGRAVEPAELSKLLAEIGESLRPADALPITRDLGDRPIFLVAIAALLACEWILRRRGGLA